MQETRVQPLGQEDPLEEEMAIHSAILAWKSRGDGGQWGSGQRGHGYAYGRFMFSSVQSLSHVRHFVAPWTVARQASLFITDSWSLLRLMSIKSVMPSNHRILCRPLLLPPSIFPSIRVFSNESVLLIKWPKYWSLCSSSVLPMNVQDWFLLGWTGWISLWSKGLSRVFSNTTVQKHQFFGPQPFFWSNSHIHAWLLEKP